MTTNTITQLADPQGFSPDPLTDLLRSGAQRLIEQAVEAELAVLLEAYACDKTGDGRARLVRHGHLPEREVITGIGAVPVKVPRVRDRGDGEEKVRFTSTLLPPYLRKAKSIEELLLDLQRRGLTHAPDVAIGPSHRCKQRLPGNGWCSGILACIARDLWCHERTALLVPQARQCSERDAEVGSGQGEGPSARHMAGRNPRECRGRFWLLRHNLRREIRQSRGETDQRPRRSLGIL
jgi:hypothetical protein